MRVVVASLCVCLQNNEGGSEPLSLFPPRQPLPRPAIVVSVGPTTPPCWVRTVVANPGKTDPRASPALTAVFEGREWRHHCAGGTRQTGTGRGRASEGLTGRLPSQEAAYCDPGCALRAA